MPSAAEILKQRISASSYSQPESGFSSIEPDAQVVPPYLVKEGQNAKHRQEILTGAKVKEELEGVKELLGKEHPRLSTTLLEDGEGLIALAWLERYYPSELHLDINRLSRELREKVHSGKIPYLNAVVVRAKLDYPGGSKQEHIAVNYVNIIGDKLDIFKVKHLFHSSREPYPETWSLDDPRERLSRLIANATLLALYLKPGERPFRYEEPREDD